MIKDDTVKSQSAGMWATAAAIDVEARNNEAYEKHQEFFDDPAYASRVDDTTVILNTFFSVKDMYVNRRSNRGKPFTVIKVTNHIFPNVSLRDKKRRFNDPLAALDVDYKFAPGTNSYLFYVRGK